MQCRDKKGLQSGRGLERLYNMKLKERQDGLKELNGQLSLWIRLKVGSQAVRPAEVSVLCHGIDFCEYVGGFMSLETSR